jgi:integrase
VFELKGKRLSRMNNKAWLKAREAAGLKEVRVHDLRPSANACALPGSVWRIDRTCSGHAGRITCHYSRAEIDNLIDCVELLCEDKKKSELTLIRCA